MTSSSMPDCLTPIKVHLQRSFPSDRLPEQDHGLNMRIVLLEGAGGRPSPLVVHRVQGRVGVSQLVHGRDPGEAETAGNVLDRPLARHQHVLVVEFGEHAQRRV